MKESTLISQFSSRYHIKEQQYSDFFFRNSKWETFNVALNFVNNEVKLIFQIIVWEEVENL